MTIFHLYQDMPCTSHHTSHPATTLRPYRRCSWQTKAPVGRRHGWNVSCAMNRSTKGTDVYRKGGGAGDGQHVQTMRARRAVTQRRNIPCRWQTNRSETTATILAHLFLLNIYIIILQS